MAYTPEPAPRQRTQEEIVAARWIKRGVLGFVLLVLVLFFLSSVVIVPTGEVAVVTQFGKVTGRELDPGFNVELPSPFQSATLFDTKVQKEQTDASAASSDLQQVDTTVAVNYHLNRDTVNKIFQNVGEDYKAKLIDPAVQESVKATTAKYNATELITNRALVKDAVDASLVARLSTYGIIVDNTSIVNFSFSSDFEKAIEEKQVASQNVLAEQQNLDKIKVQAQETVTQAQAQHDANALLQQTLTDQVLQQKAIDKWDGHLPQVSGTSTPFISIPNK